MIGSLRYWVPADGQEQPRWVRVLWVMVNNHTSETCALVIEINRPLRGMALVPLHEIRKG